MNVDDLECWCIRAAQWMQDVIDDAQAAAGNPDGETECMDGRHLLEELDAIIADLSQATAKHCCPICKGTGVHPNTANWKSCTNCGGDGEVAA